MKYVIGQSDVTGYYHVSVFDEGSSHDLIFAAMRSSHRELLIIGAGFCYLNQDDNTWYVNPDNRSESLKTGPSPIDEVIIKLFMEKALTGLELSNMMTFLRIKSGGL